LALHAWPQAPQLAVLVWVLTSQPLEIVPSQFEYPVLQLCSTHVPVAQLEVAFARLHVTPQAPQFVLVFSEVSQPLTTLPSQLANPALHTGTQAPPAHEVVPLAFVHTVVHEPHEVTLDSMFASQPFAVAPSQFAHPESHVPNAHLEFAHVPVAFA
jgi:hypothetical protein